jgi:putative endonuclease
MTRHFYVYIMTNPRKTALYTGMTNDLVTRVYQHKSKTIPGFTSRYRVSDLVYYEVAATAEAAIAREKQIKAGSRRDKIALVNGFNPAWGDLSKDF